MLNDFFLNKTIQNFPFELTSEQRIALERIVTFLFTPKQKSAFLLKGYAGTGKSSLIGALVKTMDEFRRKTVLLAPTGRAAKVFASYSNHPAYTIHKKIYRQKRSSADVEEFSTANNPHTDTLFIVDEASMISNDKPDSFMFGTGRLLDDLIDYVYSGENCRLILMGDSAQLPPVMQDSSPALQEDVLQGYGITVFSETLSQIVRQAESSGILYNATRIRQTLASKETGKYPKLSISQFQDIRNISNADLVEEISTAYDRNGIENTIIISRSNKRANTYNQGIRNTILYRENELSNGDLLMITKNNYFWTENEERINFLANGEILEVLRIRGTEKRYGFRFCNVLVRCIDHDIELEIKILLDALHSDSAGLTKERSQEFFYNILSEYNNTRTKADRMKQMRENPHYNAVQVKFAYAITCHKAQGGEWQNVFLDLGYVPKDYLGESFYRWLYTAFTRARERLYLVNLPNDFL